MLYVCAGMPRSGSTWLYNAVRLLLESAEVPGLAAGWTADREGLLAHKNPVIKIHAFDRGLALRNGLVLTSHRDLRDVAASLLRKFKDHFSMQTLRLLVEDHAQWARIAVFDLRYEDLLTDKTGQLRRVAQALQLPAATLARLPYESIAQSIDSEKFNRERRAGDLAHDRVNLLHEGHITDGRHGSWEGTLSPEIVRLIEEWFRPWLEARGYLQLKPALPAAATPDFGLGEGPVAISSPDDITAAPPPAPAISVLIPVFNGEPFLAECLESVLAQDFADFEVLVSDDCSTDGSAALIHSYAERDRRIRWWTNPCSFGIGANRNACLRAARGKLIKFVLPDDKLLDASAMRRLASTLNDDPSVSLAGSASQRMDPESKVLNIRNGFGESRVWDGKQAMLRCFDAGANLIGEPSVVMFRKSQATRGFDERMVQWLDLEMWCHLLEQGRFAHIAEPLCVFREPPAQPTGGNRGAGGAEGEPLMLAESYYLKPWVRETATPRTFFGLMYKLHKRYGRQAGPLHGEMRKQISTPQYVRCWLQYKATRPFQHLGRWLRRRGMLR